MKIQTKRIIWILGTALLLIAGICTAVFLYHRQRQRELSAGAFFQGTVDGRTWYVPCKVEDFPVKPQAWMQQKEPNLFFSDQEWLTFSICDSLTVLGQNPSKESISRQDYLVKGLKVSADCPLVFELMGISPGDPLAEAEEKLGEPYRDVNGTWFYSLEASGEEGKYLLKLTYDAVQSRIISLELSSD